jgi:hypothetical protein
LDIHFVLFLLRAFASDQSLQIDIRTFNVYDYCFERGANRIQISERRASTIKYCATCLFEASRRATVALLRSWGRRAAIPSQPNHPTCAL